MLHQMIFLIGECKFDSGKLSPGMLSRQRPGVSCLAWHRAPPGACCMLPESDVSTGKYVDIGEDIRESHASAEGKIRVDQIIHFT